MPAKKVTILIPCYNEEQNLPLLYRHLQWLMEKCSNYEFEILLINDGSRDRTLQVIRELHASDSHISYLDLSRNFGKEAAMLAGFDFATGDCVVIMDADLQDPAELIPEMLSYWEQGYDDVYAKRTDRGKESYLRKRLSLLYYHLLQKTTRLEILENVGDFRLLDRKCIEALKQMREKERNTKALFCWIGFRKKEIDFERGNRAAGHSSWKFMQLLNLAINGITSFTTAPLRIATVIGIIVSILSLTYMVYILVKTLIWGDPVQGFPTLITVILFLSGVQLLSLGIIGEYIGKVFHETKDRPIYIAREYQRGNDITAGSRSAWQAGPAPAQESPCDPHRPQAEA